MSDYDDYDYDYDDDDDDNNYSYNDDNDSENNSNKMQQEEELQQPISQQDIESEPQVNQVYSSINNNQEQQQEIIQEPKDVEHIIDYILLNAEQDTPYMLQQLEQIIFSPEEFPLIFLKLSKFFSTIKQKYQELTLQNLTQNTPETQDFLSLLKAFFQILYVTQYSTLFETYIQDNKNLKIRLEIDRKLVKTQLKNLLELSQIQQKQIQLQSEEEFQELKDILRKLFIFCLSPGEPFRAQDKALMAMVLDSLLDELLEEPKSSYFDIFSILAFQDPNQMSKWVLNNIFTFTAILRSNLQLKESEMSKDKEILILKMLQMFIVLCKNNEFQDSLIQENIPSELYRIVKFSTEIFGNGLNTNRFFRDSILVQTIVVLIKSILQGKQVSEKFCQTILDDFLYLAEQQKFDFIYSIILPILSIGNNDVYIPVCFHKNYEISKVHSQYLNDIKSQEQKRINTKEIQTQGLLPSWSFEQEDRQIFQKTFQKLFLNQQQQQQDNEQKQFKWNQILNKNQEGLQSNLTFKDMQKKLENKENLLYLFKTFHAGKPAIFGAFASQKHGKDTEQNPFDRLAGEHLKSLKSPQSFYFYYTEDTHIHFTSQQKIQKQQSKKHQTDLFPILGQESNQQQQQQQQEFTTQDMVRMVPLGMEFLLDDEAIISINFKDLDRSKFKFPLQKIDNLEKNEKIKTTWKMNPETCYLISIEIWEWQQSRNQIDNFLNLFEVKEDLRSIYDNYLKLFRKEKVYLVPQYATMQSLQNEIVLHDEDYKDLQGFGGIKSLSSSSNKIYENSIKIQDLSYIFNKTGILDLVINDERISANRLRTSDLTEETFRNDDSQNESTQIMKQFDENLKGLNKIIDKLAKLAYRNFNTYLVPFYYQLENLLKIPQYSSFLLKNQEFFKLLLALQFGSTQTSSQKKTKDFQLSTFHQVTSILFKSLRQLLQNKSENQTYIKKYLFDKDLIPLIINKLETIIGGLPSSKKLKKKAQNQPETQTKQAELQTAEQQLKEYRDQKKQEQEREKLKNVQKPTGVGYAGHASSDVSWQNKAEYQKNTLAENLDIDFSDSAGVSKLLGKDYVNQLTIDLIQSMASLFESPEKFKISLKTYKILRDETNLVQIILFLFKQNSFVDGTKNVKLFESLMQLVWNMSQYDEILDFFVYQDYDMTIYEMLQNMQVQVDFFEQNQANLANLQGKKLHENNENEGTNLQQLKEKEEYQKTCQKLINRFNEVFQNIHKKLEASQYLTTEKTQKNSDKQLQDLKTNPKSSQKTAHFEQFYSQIMKSLACDSYDMKEGTKSYKHHYSSQISSSNSTPPQTKINRLIREISELANGVPMEASNSIFVRYDKNRIDLMKICIFGSSDTPYAHGAFIYDMYFDDNYPQKSPKCNLSTTGNGKIRFNPNLYNCGKVCLSLLGTWGGNNPVENWNPNISSILQVLVSIQAIVMSPYIYYNEPGQERHMGTEDGELRNNGYQNVVRWGNIKYAINEQLMNPPQGFEEVIRKNFYLKKDMILKETEKWLEEADRPVKYDGAQNPSITQQFTSKGYKKMLTEEIEKMRKLLDSLSREMGEQIQTKSQENQQKITVHYDKPSILSLYEIKKEQVLQDSILNPNWKKLSENLSNIDISYDYLQQNQRKIDLSNKQFENRISRSIGAVGKEAILKQTQASVFIAGLKPLGIEIAKNIVLSGVQRLTIFDPEVATSKDLGGQFYLTQEDVQASKYISEASLPKLQQLNYYVQVDQIDPKSSLQSILKTIILQQYDVIILVNQPLSIANQINQYLRQQQKQQQRPIKFIFAEQYGVFSRNFVDFGPDFTVEEPDSETPEDYMIKSIQQLSQTQLQIDLLEQNKNPNFEENSHVIFKEIVETQLPSKSSLNNTPFKITQQISKNSFIIQANFENYQNYIRNGLVQQKKQSKTINFDSFDECMLQNLENQKFDDQWGFLWTPEQHLERRTISLCFNLLSIFKEQLQRPLKTWDLEDLNTFYSLFQQQNYLKTLENSIKNNEISPENQQKIIQTTIMKFVFPANGLIPSQSALIGGIIAQEALKSITKKWTPLNQILIHSLPELLIPLNWSHLQQNFASQNHKTLQEHLNEAKKDHYLYDLNSRYDNLRLCIGQHNLQKLQGANLFMIGAGAIGCELLKNYSMQGIATQFSGQIIVTDPDIIENSNLSRQFLFREKHLRKPKSTVAAAVAQQMNPDLQNRIFARLDKVEEKTENLYSEQFYRSQSIVMNALDNVQARLYVDNQCVKAQRPLIESGTLGSKGHVQVILPQKTETYGSSKDPETDNNDIPVCTLKMFPEQTIHCVEWARDKFGKIFTQKPASLKKILLSFQQSLQQQEEQDDFEQLEMKTVMDAYKILGKRPLNFKDCIAFSRKKFEKMFNQNIQALLKVHPLDKKNQDGSYFWNPPKRPPTAQSFDPINNENHRNFIISTAALRAHTFNISVPTDIKDPSAQKSHIKDSQNVNISDLKISAQKLKQLEKESKEQQTQEENNEQQQQMIIEEEEEEKSEKMEIEQEEEDIDKPKKWYIAQIVSKLSHYLKFDPKGEKVINHTPIPKDLIPTPIEFEKDNDDNFHIDFLTAATNNRASNYSLESMDWLTVKLKAGRIIPALATTTSTVAGLQTIEMIKVLQNQKLENYKNAFLNLSVPFLQQSEPGSVQNYKINEGLESNIWDKWDITLELQDSLQILYQKLYKKYKIYPNDLSQGNKQIYAFDLMQMKPQENNEILNKKIIELLSLSNAHENFSDVYITFTREDPYKLYEQQLQLLQQQQQQQNVQNKIKLKEKEYIKGIPLIRIHFNI